MNKFISNNVLRLFIIVFFTGFVIQSIITLELDKKSEYAMVLNHSRLLSTYTMSNWIYYQNLHHKDIMKLNKKILQELPIYSFPIILKDFSNKNKNDITVRIVSDIPRNPNNKANKYELEAMKIFKKNKNKKDYFKKYDTFYQYSIPLKINQNCLKCHGKKKDAPKFIQKKYKNAYNYKLGDLRGILSIRTPQKVVEQYFYKPLLINFTKDTLLLIFIFLAVFYISKKNRKFSRILQQEVNKKTRRLLENKQRLEYLSKHDELTDLPNKLYLKNDIKKFKNLKLAYINIDAFGNINDVYGIPFGDVLLKEFSNYLKKLSVKNGLSLYRLHSDEFALLHANDIKEDTFVKIIQNILDKLNSKVFWIKGIDITLSSTIGICFDKKDILSKTNIALKEAKNKNENIIIYDKNENIEQKIQKNLEIIKDIKNAIIHNNFIMYFQLIYDINTGKKNKYEALVRMIDKNGNVKPPLIFLELAKKAKLYHKITKIILTKTLQMQQRYPEYYFSINISIDDILHEDTANFIKQTIKNFTYPKKLIFEILESDKIENYKYAKEFIKEIKKCGCRVSIDDFGSGYSNFAHIIALDIDFLKIDASLIKNINKDKISYEVVKAIVSFSKTLGIKTVAEFVDSKNILDVVKDLGIDYAQGYYLGKPSPEIE